MVAEGETWKPTTHPKIVALDVSPVERRWLEGKLDELDALVEAGDTLDLSAASPRSCASRTAPRERTRWAPRRPQRPP